MTEITNDAHLTPAPVPTGPVVLGDGTDITAKLTSVRESAHAAVADARVVLEDGNDVTDGIEPDETPKKPRLKRRDLLEVSALLQRNKIPVSEMSISLGAQFLSEKKAGETKLRFQDWLDEDVAEDDDEDEEYGDVADGEGPTES